MRPHLKVAAAAALALSLTSAPAAAAQGAGSLSGLGTDSLASIIGSGGTEPGPGTGPGTGPGPGDQVDDRFIRGIIDATNRERAKAGLTLLSHRAEMSTVTQAWTDSVAASRRLPTAETAHNNDAANQIPGGWTYGVGENCAAFPTGSTPQEVVNGWMGSEGHRANVLRPGFNSIGVGVSAYPNLPYFYVCELMTAY